MLRWKTGWGTIAHDGPEDVLEFAKSNGYRSVELADTVAYAEKSEELGYRLLIGTKDPS